MRASSIRQRQRILAAATRKFADDGFLGARVDDIAAAAGVNKRLLYHYVGGKADLFAAVLQQQAQQLEVVAVSDPRTWLLILQEAAHADTRVLFEALVAAVVRHNPEQVRTRLAEAMFTALLPVALLPDRGEMDRQASGHSGEKPRLRMMPKVTASAD